MGLPAAAVFGVQNCGSTVPPWVRAAKLTAPQIRKEEKWQTPCGSPHSWLQKDRRIYLEISRTISRSPLRRKLGGFETDSDLTFGWAGCREHCHLRPCVFTCSLSSRIFPAVIADVWHSVVVVLLFVTYSISIGWYWMELSEKKNKL